MNNDPQNNGPKVYSIDGVTPVIDPTAYVHPTAVLIGDVIIGPGCYVGPLACLRGDFGRLIMEFPRNGRHLVNGQAIVRQERLRLLRMTFQHNG